MTRPDIAVVFDERISNDDFDIFEDSVKSEGLSLMVQSREPNGPQACLEWAIPSMVVAYLGKSYFDGFLKEMGKEHYHSLKDGLSSLTTKVMDKPRIEPMLLGTPGKISSNNPFSLVFSIQAETDDNFTFKLLVPKRVSDCNYDEIISKFMVFLDEYHLGLQTLKSIGFIPISDDPRHPLPYQIFVHYCTESNAIRWLNPKDYR